ncbi:MAG TPA: DUF3048 domain-containing protein [Candidatus Saccharimonadales bacterium]|nr:DUF3048 domain-containing protein [Candidatus Saccharimonadales bacterium]
MDGPTQKPPHRLAKLHAWAHRHKSVLLFVAALAIITSSGIVVLALMYEKPVPAPKETVPIKKVIPKKFYSPLTGVEVPDEGTTKRQVTGIMIENSPDARPQSGIKSAGIVFEAIAEGGITRFLTLFQEARPGLIGPVRSVRPYYVEWAAAFDESLAHVGGSARALQMIRSGSYGHDIDQFFNGGSYWRATDRVAPHNVYTNFDKLDALNQSKGYTSSTFEAFPRAKTELPSKAPNATSIAVNISGADYNSTYAYDGPSNSYLRSEGGGAHKDREAGQLNPKVVIVIKVSMTLGFEDGNREQIQTTGSGVADVFQNGTVTEGTWDKADAKGQIHFKDAAGKVIPLNSGQTWITALPSDRTVSWR